MCSPIHASKQANLEKIRVVAKQEVLPDLQWAVMKIEIVKLYNQAYGLVFFVE